MKARPLGNGIRLCANGHLAATVRAGGLQRFRRFPEGTAITTVRRWQDETRASLRLAAAGRAPQAPTGSLDEAVGLYLGTLTHRPKLKAERNRQLAWWSAKFPGRSLASVKASEVAGALSALRASGAAASTCNHYRQALRALFGTLDGTANPVTQTPAFGPPPAEPRGLSYALVGLILDTVSNMGGPKARTEGSKARARLRVIAYTGMRHSELKRLRPEDWNRDQHSLVIRTGKGGRTRTIPLVTEAESALTDLIRVDAIGPFSNSNVRRAFMLACRKLNLTGIRPYDLRHTFGTCLYEASGDLRIVAEMMGHSSTRTTERYTLGYVPDYMKLVAKRFQALLTPAAEPAPAPEPAPEPVAAPGPRLAFARR